MACMLGQDEELLDLDQVLSYGDTLRSQREEMEYLRGRIREDPELARAIGRSFLQADQKLQDAIQQYSTIYRALYGEMPPGLGVAWIAAAPWIVAGLYGIALTIKWLGDWLVTARAEDNKAKAIANARAAEDRGDKESASKWLALAKGTSQELEKWFNSYWPLLAAGLGLVLVLPRKR